MDPSKKIRPLPEILPERDNEKNAEKEIGLAGTFAERKLLKKKLPNSILLPKETFEFFVKNFFGLKEKIYL